MFSQGGACEDNPLTPAGVWLYPRYFVRGVCLEGYSL